MNDHKGRIPLSNQMNFWKNSKWPLTPPPFLENYIANLFIMDMVAFMQGGIGQIVSVNISQYLSVKAIYQTLPLGSKSSIFDQIWSFF